jgi:GntR family transcriptional regulator
MESERLLRRRQGRGTFVAELDEQHILFHFFKLTSDDGIQRFPASHVIDVAVASASEAERDRLALGAGEDVIRIRRLRSLAGETVILEDIALPEAIFAALRDAELPNNLYGLYAGQFGITVVQVRERLKAIAIDPARATLLQVAEGAPALQIDRVAWDLDARPVEWRVSYCLTERFHYRSDVS